ncbi:MAG: Type secretion system pilin [Candidatus Parcubacteria bacterium]|jgi:heme/copper-type cytochrome/quinol oxidase subunit 2
MSLLQKIGFFVMCLPALLLGFVATSVFALEGTGAGAGEGTGAGAGEGTGAGGQQIQQVTLNNPLKVNSIEELLVAILNIIMVLMIPIIVFFIILAGFKYVTARGNSGQIEEATTTFTYAIIGAVLILAAVAIAEIIKNTVASFAA